MRHVDAEETFCMKKDDQPRTVVQLISFALFDPGAILGRDFAVGPESDETEPLHAWQTRAIFQALQDAGLVIAHEEVVSGTEQPLFATPRLDLTLRQTGRDQVDQTQ